MNSPMPVLKRWSPSPAVTLSAAVVSDVGRVRDHNEDSWLIEPPLFVVADGMGGHDAGDAASRMVVESFSTLAGAVSVGVADVENCLREAASRVDTLDVGERGAPGSTVVLGVYVVEGGRDCWLIANIGDSRAYSWGAGGLEQISHDHSVVQDLIEAGEIDEDEARTHPERHVITRAIGALQGSTAEYSLIPVEPGSRLLLCSDGLSSEVTDLAISQALASGQPSTVTAQELADAALSAGGRDNVTVIVVDVEGGSAPDAETTLRQPDRVDEDTVRTGSR